MMCPTTLAAMAALAFSVPVGANTPPATPIVTEPATDGRIVSAFDVHMECSTFSDADPGDAHRCSDWEIWTLAPAERVWVTTCIGGVERTHTHLGDGAFENSHAGRSELIANTIYRLRVRHRDSSDDTATEWSGWGERTFQTGPATQIFPLLLDDIVAAPVPTWIGPGGAPISLPLANPPPSLRIETAEGGTLLDIRAFDGTTNQQINPAALGAHSAVRARLSAGGAASALLLPESQLVFTTHDGEIVTIYLEAAAVQPGADRFYWVAETGASYRGTAAQTSPDFSTLARGVPVPWTVRQPGFKVEIVASGFQMPVNIAFVPNPGTSPNSPFYYVTELYGTIKSVARDGTIRDYASGLLNFNPTGNFPGSGEQGLSGVVVDPANGDVYAAMLYSSVPGVEGVPHYPKVVRFISNDGGLTATSQATILNMTGESQGQSHQISNLSFGPDGMLYLHMGDGFDTATAQNLASYRGKILRLNKTGAAPPDNPFYDAANGINARDYVFAYGVRNPFGGAWRQDDGSLYEVENGPSVDRFAKIVRARNYLWSGSDASMTNFAIYNWVPAVGPVNLAFIQPGTQGGSGFPPERMDHAFVSESGPTWGTGPQANGKRISEFVLDAAGNRLSGPTPLIEYAGTGKATVVALAAGPDGLYFSDFYKDLEYTSPIDRGSNLLRVRYVGIADFTADIPAGPAPHTVTFTDTSTVPAPTSWAWDFGDGQTSAQRNPVHTYEDEGVYNVRLSVAGSAGLFVQVRQNYIRVGDQRRIAMIGGSVPPSGADAAVADHLRARGFEVDSLDDEPSNRPSAGTIATEYDLVIVSSTSTSANVAGQFRTAPIPMVFWEQALLRSDREALQSDGISIGGITQVSIADNTHPITEGLSLGTIDVFPGGATMSVGRGSRGSGIRLLATRAGAPTDAAILVAEAGAAGLNGYIMPARRAFLFFEDASYAAANVAARQILDRAACWAMGASSPTLTAQPQSASVLPGETVTLSVSVQGTGPFTFAWRRNGQPISGATQRRFSIAAATPADAGIYDVVIDGPCGTVTSAPATLTVLPPCACDWNGAAGLDSQDFFEFLDDFFAGDADFNGTDGTDSQDYFDFLNCYFNGCAG